MKIAILSDIHGNDKALFAVLDRIKQLKVCRIFILGDLVGYYYHPDKVLEMLEPWDCEFVQGNHDRMLKTALDDPTCLDAIGKKYGSGLRLALDKLDSAQIDFLINLPTSKKLSCEGHTFCLSHGTPWDQDTYIYPDASDKLLEKCAETDTDYVLMGHTHYPFVRIRQKTLLLNPGSVGQARDIGGQASWALFDTCSLSFVFQHTPYPVQELVKEVIEMDPEVPYLHQILQRK